MIIFNKDKYVLGALSEEFWKQEYHLVTGEFQKLEDKLNAAMKVVEAARDMSQRLQSLPWSKNKDGTMVMIDTATWKQWNYGECQVLHNTVVEYDKVAGRYSKEQGE